jgi:hypothetical protein
MKRGFYVRTAFGGAALVMIVACACPKKGGGGAGTGSGSGSGSSVVAPPAGGCDGLRPRIEAMYRAEAQAREPKRVEEAVADNTAMVMAECAKAPDRFGACFAQAPTGNGAEAQGWTAKDLETHCMPQLDDEGSEGDALR